jgi:phosphomannomutase
VAKLKAGLGIVITASHNPPSYNGYKLKASYGGPMIPSDVQELEDMIPDACSLGELPTVRELSERGLFKTADLEGIYLKHARRNFDLKLIKASAGKIAYDAMYGAGQNAVKKLLPRCVFLHCDYNPGMHGQAPEPIHRNLQLLSETIRKNPKITAGLANDGDADRIGLYRRRRQFCGQSPHPAYSAPVPAQVQGNVGQGDIYILGNRQTEKNGRSVRSPL